MMAPALQAGRARTLRRWTAAATVVIALHLSIAAAALHRTEPELAEDDVAGSAMPIELAAATASHPSDIAPRVGAPAAEVAEQVVSDAREDAAEEPQEKIEPVAEPTPIQTPDALRHQPNIEQTDEKPKPPSQQPPVPAAVANPAQEAAALPSPSAPETAQAASASQGITPSMRKSKTSWQKSLLVHVAKSKRYPVAARSSQAEGEAVVEFSMDRSGALISKRLVSSSGSSLLDSEALDMLTRAEPLPQPPTDIAGEVFTLAMPIRFRLR